MMTTNTTYQPAWEIMAAYLSGNASTENILLVEQWIAASDENKKEFEKIEKTWLLSQSPKLGEINIESAWQRVSLKANIKPQAKIIALSRKYFMRAAAVLAVGAATWFAYQQMPTQKSVMAANEIIQLSLPDGSVVDLNKHAQLKYPSKFKRTAREVELNGEAFFSITRNPSQPFIIKTRNAEIKVLGTSFNVGSNNNGDLEVIVKTGYVSVTSNTTGENTLLVKNEKATILATNGSLIKSVNTNENYLAWKTRIFTFRETGLNDVFPTLEKAYGIKIDVKDSILLKNKLTATFENMEAKEIINVIDKTFGFESTIIADKIIIGQKQNN